MTTYICTYSSKIIIIFYKINIDFFILTRLIIFIIIFVFPISPLPAYSSCFYIQIQHIHRTHYKAFGFYCRTMHLFCIENLKEKSPINLNVLCCISTKTRLSFSGITFADYNIGITHITLMRNITLNLYRTYI